FNLYFGENNRCYTVKPGAQLSDSWQLKALDSGRYEFRVHGPNGFQRIYKGDKENPPISIDFDYEKKNSLTRRLSGNVILNFKNDDSQKDYIIRIEDVSYKNTPVIRKIEAGKKKQRIVLNLSKSYNWYDFVVRV